jgi:putative membrane protein
VLRRLSAAAATGLSALSSVTAVSAHGIAGEAGSGAWSFDPLAMIALGVVAYVHGRSIEAVRETAGGRRLLPQWRVCCFYSATLVLLIAVASPLEHASDESFSAHMLQHLLLLTIAPPLLVLSRPAITVAHALGRPLRRLHAANACLGKVSRRQELAWLAFTLALWVWHAPPLYKAALQSPFVHLAEHACFVLAGLWLWSIVLNSRGAVRNVPANVLLVFGSMLQMSLLGALMTFSGTPWYEGAYGSGLAGLTPVEDQHLAGVMMWIPTNFVLLAALVYTLLLWLARDEAASEHATTWASIRNLLDAG